MLDFSLRRSAHLGVALLGAALLASDATNAHAVVLAYEGFNYSAGSKIVDANNDGIYDDGLGAAGGGWAASWDNSQNSNAVDASSIDAASLSYTDGLGNVLTTTGGSLLNTGAGGISQPGRNLAARRDGVTLGATATTPVSTWMSFLAIRQGQVADPGYNNPVSRAGTFTRGANLSLFDSTQVTPDWEKLNIGENSNSEYPFTTGNDLLAIQRAAAVDPAQFEYFKQRFGSSSTLSQQSYDVWMVNAPRVSTAITAQAAPGYEDPIDGTITNQRDWHVNPNNGRFNAALTHTPFGLQVGLALIRVDHYGGEAPRDVMRLWMNPNLNAAPSDASASAVIDYAAIEARGLTQATAVTTPFNGVEGNLLSFDRIRLFAGQEQTNANPVLTSFAAQWSLDEIRFGTTFADVTPHSGAAAAVPEPAPLSLIAAALATVLGLRRRK
jgi:hypothetical protein